MSIQERVATNIRNARTRAGLTQSQVAEKCGFKNSLSIHFIERNKRELKVDHLVLIAEALGVNPSELLSLHP
jgi:transcriptional regulator with XRE-family HTH domain